MSSPSPQRGLWQLTDARSDKKFTDNKGHTYFRHASTGLWWSKDTARHGGSAFKVYRMVKGTLKWIYDANEYGDFIVGKHKGPTGKMVSLPFLIL